MNLLRAILISVCGLIASCGDGDQKSVPAPDSRAKSIVTSNYPLYYFATRITQGVNTAPEITLPDIDGDPATWTPDAGQIQILQSADLIVLNGAGAEAWLDLVTLDQTRLLDTTAALSDRLIPLDEDVVHQHGPAGEHSHQGTAFTTWLDPDMSALQAGALTNGIATLDPDNASTYKLNQQELENDLRELDTEMSAAFQLLDRMPVVFSHPVYQYLEHRYGINGISVHWEPNEVPSITNWVDLQQKLQSHPARLMVWEGEPLDAVAERLAGSGISSVIFDPAANRPESGDYLEVMTANIGRLREILESDQL